MKPWYKRFTFWCNLFVFVNLVLALIEYGRDELGPAVWCLVSSMYLEILLLHRKVDRVLYGEDPERATESEVEKP